MFTLLVLVMLGQSDSDMIELSITLQYKHYVEGSYGRILPPFVPHIPMSLEQQRELAGRLKPTPPYPPDPELRERREYDLRRTAQLVAIIRARRRAYIAASSPVDAVLPWYPILGDSESISHPFGRERSLFDLKSNVNELLKSDLVTPIRFGR